MQQTGIHYTNYHIGSYFENHFTDTMVNNTTVMSEEESNSSSSISPNDKVSLAYPQPYFISTAATYLMSDYDCRPTHPYAALTNQGMMYPSSSPEEQQAYVPSDEALSTTTSPSSTMVSASLHQFSPGLPFTASSKECNSEEMGFYSCPDGSGYDYSQSMFDYRPSLSPNGTLSPVEVPMVSYSDRHCDNKRHSTDSVCYSKHADSSSHHHHHHHHNEAQEKKSGYVKRHSQSKAKKRCSNCHTPQSPSWRRSISKSTKGDLLCNACGL
jgi:hypothetical protein